MVPDIVSAVLSYEAEAVEEGPRHGDVDALSLAQHDGHVVRVGPRRQLPAEGAGQSLLRPHRLLQDALRLGNDPTIRLDGVASDSRGRRSWSHCPIGLGSMWGTQGLGCGSIAAGDPTLVVQMLCPWRRMMGSMTPEFWAIVAFSGKFHLRVPPELHAAIAEAAAADGKSLYQWVTDELRASVTGAA